jgi:hypothetical protein
MLDRVDGAPDEVRELARTRSTARAARDWATADRLKEQIEAAGWKLVDRGTDFTLVPAHPPDVVAADGHIRYGWSGSVPSRLAEPPTTIATVVMRMAGRPDLVAEALTGLRAHAPGPTQVVAVVDDPATHLVSSAIDEVVETEPAGHAAGLNAGIRRATGGIVVLLDPSVEIVGDVVAQLVDALGDPTVAASGAFGLTSNDLRRFSAAPAGEVTALEDALIAFRRADYVERGPLDERFRLPGSTGTWWSLVLRDEGPERPARRALALELPVRRNPAEPGPGGNDERLAKRDFYRVLDRFGGRRDLLLPVTDNAAGG